jgi:hypothetical protein
VTKKIVINRPWISSFNFEAAPYSDTKLEQIHKLSRNYVSSLDLGCPHVSPVKSYEDDREAYKAWVADWKRVYAGVSNTIRLLKTFRKTVTFPALTSVQKAICAREYSGEVDYASKLNALSERQLGRMQETAQILLNARYNAKLAAAEARRRHRAALPAEEVKEAA